MYRMKKISGYITDSNGNVEKSSSITIKRNTPRGSISIDSTKTDFSGWFDSKPLPVGEYDIYSGPIHIGVVDNIIKDYIACHTTNYEDSDNDSLNKNIGEYMESNSLYEDYIGLLSIDGEYPFFPNTDNIAGNTIDELGRVVLGVYDKVSISKFNIEYYGDEGDYIKWSNVRAYYIDSLEGFVLGLSYKDIILEAPRASYVSNDSATVYNVSDNKVKITIDTSLVAKVENVTSISSSFKLGDVVNLGAKSYIVTNINIYKDVSSNQDIVELDAEVIPGELSEYVDGYISIYPGMFYGMLSNNSFVANHFTVREVL